MRIRSPIQPFFMPSRLAPGIKLKHGVLIDERQPIGELRNMADQLTSVIRLSGLPPQTRRIADVRDSTREQCIGKRSEQHARLIIESMVGLYEFQQQPHCKNRRILPRTALSVIQMHVSSKLIQNSMFGHDDRQDMLLASCIDHKGSEFSVGRLKDCWH